MLGTCRTAFFVSARRLPRSVVPRKRFFDSILAVNACTYRPLYSISSHPDFPALTSAQKLGITPNLVQSRAIRWSAVSRSDGKKEVSKQPDEEPKGLLAKFKYLWKRYWYIVIPVHCVTSAVWFGSFYWLAASGVDVVGFVSSLSFIPESWLSALHKAPAAGNLAVAYALYKVASPLRYSVTIGGAHLCIRLGSNMNVLRTSTEVRADVKDYSSNLMLRHRHRYVHYRDLARNKGSKIYKQIRRRSFRHRNGGGH